jgi:hypothetical protein
VPNRFLGVAAEPPRHSAISARLPPEAGIRALPGSTLEAALPQGPVLGRKVIMDALTTVLLPLHSLQRVPLRIGRFGARGRGVVADRAIAAGTLIERSPVLVIPPRDRAATDGSIVFTYVFMWEHGTVEEDLYKHEGRSAIALGYTSLLNHSYTPNCEFIRHIDELMIDLVALRDIAAGEELTIDYQMTLWFTPE